MDVLFIGNSFTYFNDMPYTFLNMLKTFDESSKVETIAYGGYSLSQYADENTEIGKMVISKIVSYEWDYIVLQEQSLLPCTDALEFKASVKKIAKIASTVDAKILLYQTWAYEDGTDKLGSTGMTYGDMAQRLRNAYFEAAKEINGTVAPVGELFYKVHNSEHITALINRDDGYHPSSSGSYLAACVIFKVMTGKSTIGLPCPSNVSLYNLSLLQKLSNEL